MKLNKNINVGANLGSTGTTDLCNKYFGLFGKVPNLISVSDAINDTSISEFLVKNGFTKNCQIFYQRFDDKKPYKISSFENKAEEIYILIDDSALWLLHSDSDPKKYMDEFLKKEHRREVSHSKELCIIVPENGSYRTSYHELKRTEFVPENYNEDFEPIHEEIVKNLSLDRSGLYLFYGLPGTGKSSYIASLTHMDTNKKFIYLPSSLFNQLDSPVLMQLFLNNRNSIFIIEDGEKLLINREVENNSPISALLNMSDGLIGQLLNSQIICTFNTSLDKIDEALLRNGRLISMYEFTALSKERAISLAKKIDKPYAHIKGAVTLADIYNQSDKEAKSFKPKRKAIGFKEHTI